MRLLFALALSVAACAPRPTKPHRHSHRHHEAHHMPHRFRDAARWAKRFENPKRDRWQRPQAVIARLDLRPDLRIADIGSATGYFTVRLARAVPRGRVWGVDIEADMVRYLNRRAAQEKLTNLKSIRGGAADAKLPEAVDLIFVSNTYHHIPKRVGYFQRLRAKLRPRGRLAIVDFKGGKIPVGPPERHRILPPQLDRELTQAGWRRVLLDVKTLPYQYIAIYVTRAAAPDPRSPR